MRAMDDAGFPPRMAVWVHNTDTDTWKLWVVPPKGLTDERDFFRRCAAVVSANRPSLGGLDVSDVKMVEETHPAMVGLSVAVRVPGLARVHFSGNRFNGFYLPDCIILRSAL